MSPRIGRPKSENPRTIEVKIRLTKGENEEITEYCKEFSITRVEAIRKGIRKLLDEK